MYRNVVNDFMNALDNLIEANGKGTIPDDEINLVVKRLRKIVFDITDNNLQKINAKMSSLFELFNKIIK